VVGFGGRLAEADDAGIERVELLGKICVVTLNDSTDDFYSLFDIRETAPNSAEVESAIFQ
jgi:hypothetical protein